MITSVQSNTLPQSPEDTANHFKNALDSQNAPVRPNLSVRTQSSNASHQRNLSDGSSFSTFSGGELLTAEPVTIQPVPSGTVQKIHTPEGGNTDKQLKSHFSLDSDSDRESVYSQPEISPADTVFSRVDQNGDLYTPITPVNRDIPVTPITTLHNPDAIIVTPSGEKLTFADIDGRLDAARSDAQEAKIFKSIFGIAPPASNTRSRQGVALPPAAENAYRYILYRQATDSASTHKDALTNLPTSANITKDDYTPEKLFIPRNGKAQSYAQIDAQLDKLSPSDADQKIKDIFKESTNYLGPINRDELAYRIHRDADLKFNKI